MAGINSKFVAFGLIKKVKNGGTRSLFSHQVMLRSQLFKGHIHSKTYTPLVTYNGHSDYIYSDWTVMM